MSQSESSPGVPLVSRIAAQAAIIIGGLAFLYVGMVGRRAGWELMSLPVLACLPCALAAVVGGVIGLRNGATLAAVRTFAPAVVGVGLAIVAFFMGA